MAIGEDVAIGGTSSERMLVMRDGLSPKTLPSFLPRGPPHLCPHGDADTV